MPVPKKAEARLVAGLKRFQPILASARARDINEADTVTIVKDLLADLFGYDKYTEVTGEHEIRATLRSEVLKREVVEGDQANAARKRVQRAAGKALRAAKPRADAGDHTAADAVAAPAPAPETETEAHDEAPPRVDAVGSEG